MGNRLILAFVMAATPFVPRAAAAPVMLTPAAAPAEPNPGSFERADAALDEAYSSIKALKRCMDHTAVLHADWSTAQKRLNAEFGTVPPAFRAFLAKKRHRADRQERECLQLVPLPGTLFTKAHEYLRQIEPKNTPGIAGRFKKIEAGRAQYNKVIAATKRNSE